MLKTSIQNGSTPPSNAFTPMSILVKSTNREHEDCLLR